jgi:hypothetical protein
MLSALLWLWLEWSYRFSYVMATKRTSTQRAHWERDRLAVRCLEVFDWLSGLLTEYRLTRSRSCFWSICMHVCDVTLSVYPNRAIYTQSNITNIIFTCMSTQHQHRKKYTLYACFQISRVYKHDVYTLTLYLDIWIKIWYGLETKQKSLHYVFVSVYVNSCTVTVIELIVFSYN